MEIRIRRAGHGKYVDVQFRYMGTEIDLGFQDEQERRALAMTLQQAIDELLEGLEPPQ